MGGIKRTSVFIRVFLAFFSGLIFLTVAAQAALWSGLFWLNSSAGKDWLEGRLSVLSARSGYAVAIKNIDGLTFHGVNVGSLSIADAGGPVLEGRKLTLHLNFFSLFEKKLSLSATADSLSLYRLPKSEKSSASFSLPDIYFNAVHLEKVKTAELFLAKDILGSGVTTAATLSARLEQRDKSLSLKLALDTFGTNPDFLPRKIAAEALLSPTGKLAVNDIEVAAPTYAFNGKGEANLNNDAIDFTLHGGSSSMPGIQGKLAFDGHLTGTAEKPALDASGVLNLAALADYIPGDIHFKIISDNTPAGHIEMKAPYKGNELMLTADFLYAEDTLHLKDIKGVAPEGKFSGALDYDTATNLAAGKLDAAVDYGRLSGSVSGQGNARILLSSRRARQTISVTLHDFSIGEAAVNALVVDLSPAAEKNFYAVSTKGSIRYRKLFSWSGTATVGGNDLKTAAVRDIRLSVTAAQGSLSLMGDATQKIIDLSARLKSVPVDALPMPQAYDVLDKTKISGSVMLKGSFIRPVIKTDLSLSQIQALRGGTPVAMHLTAVYADEKLLAGMTAAGKGISKLQGHAELPFRLSLYPFHADNIKKAALSANLAMDMETRAALQAFIPAGVMLGGRLKGNVTITGTVDNPNMAGKTSLVDGSFTQTAKGLELRNIDMQAVIDNKDLDITSLTAQEHGSGTIAVRGKIGVGRENLPVDLSVQCNEIRLFHASDLISGSFSADAAVTGDARAYMVGGKVTAHRVNITLPARLNSDIPQLNIVHHDKQEVVASDMKNVRLQMQLVAENQVFVRGWGLDAEFGGALKVEGTLAESLFIGSFDSRRGRYEEFGKRFDLKYAHLRFEGTVPPSPFLDVQAETGAQDITAQINLKGNISKPEITLSSTPALPQDEVLSHILFGKNLTSISPFQAIQLANTLQQLSGQGGGSFEPLSIFRKATRLDDLQIEKNENGTTTVGAGKYITDKVYLEAETGSGENSGAAKVRVDLTPQVKAESKIGQDNKTGGGIFWQRDY